MVTLRTEHKIASLEGWRKAFDSDPLDRKKAGVKHFRIYQPLEEQDLVIIELDFDYHEEAKAMQTKLDQLFPKIEGTIIFGVRMSLFALIESTDL